MKYSSLTQRIAGKSADAWKVHYEAMNRLNAGDDIYLLSVGQETGQRTPDFIVEAAQASLQNGRHHYTPVEGFDALREMIATNHRKRTGQVVNRNNIVVFAGAQNALFAIGQCLLEHSDEVIIPEPYYTTYPASFTASGATLRSIPCLAEDEFQVNVEGIVDSITPATKVIVLNSPNNPTGAVYEHDRVEAVARVCVEKKIWLLGDEVYASLVPENKHTGVASIAGVDEIAITVSSLSKSHRMTGWRIGWAVVPEKLAKHLTNLNLCMSYGLPPFIQDAAQVALSDEGATSQTIAGMLNNHRGILLQGLNDIPDILLFPSIGGMFIMLDIKQLAISGQDFAQGLLDNYDVAVLPCDGFGAAGEGLIRVSACESEARLLEACRRIKEYVTAL